MSLGTESPITRSTTPSPPTELRLWDRPNKAPGSVVRIDKDKVLGVRHRLWRDKNGNNRDGCVVEMMQNHDPDHYNLANTAAEVRRELGIIEKTPKGSDPVRTN